MAGAIMNPSLMYKFTFKLSVSYILETIMKEKTHFNEVHSFASLEIYHLAWQTACQ